MIYSIGVFVGLLIASLVVWAVNTGSGGPLDSTDNHTTGDRSGLRILIDHGTGCQYLRTSSGGITPRLDANGKPMCGVVK